MSDLRENKEVKNNLSNIIQEDAKNNKISISMNESFMPGFFLTDYKIDIFPLDISKSDYLITSIVNDKIYIPSFLNDESKIDKIKTCMQSYIDSNFKPIGEINEIIIYKKD